MKYMILLYDDQTDDGYDELPPDEFEAAMKVHIDFDDWCKDNEVTVDDSQALQLAKNGWSVQSTGEEYDGPYMELKEHLGGFYLIDAPSHALAQEAARRCPNYGTNELRPLAVRD